MVASCKLGQGPTNRNLYAGKGHYESTSPIDIYFHAYMHAKPASSNHDFVALAGEPWLISHSS